MLPPLAYLTQAAKLLYDDDLSRYKQETFPMLVASKNAYAACPIICTTTESFAQFIADVKEMLGLKADEFYKFVVYWNPEKGVESAHTTLYSSNLHACLRMMEAMPGKCQVAVSKD